MVCLQCYISHINLSLWHCCKREPCMFPDICIASTLKLQKVKICYSWNWSIFQQIGHIKCEMMFSVSLSIDESLNDICQKQHLDLVANFWAPICVVGMTSRVDVTELLEKRVKSRFSHRSILLIPNYTAKERVELFNSLLSLNSPGKKSKDGFVQNWNKNINNLCKERTVQEILEKQLFCDNDEKLFRSFLLYLICKIPILSNARLSSDIIKDCYDSWYYDAKEVILQGLSTLELCLVIAMTHQMELYDEEPFNFEMILDRYLKFARRSNSVKLCEKPVILKAFERIRALELIIPLSGVSRRCNLKEYDMYCFLLTKSQVKNAVQSYVGLQTDIIQWASSSID